jgi:hypothetical protein
MPPMRVLVGSRVYFPLHKALAKKRKLSDTHKQFTNQASSFDLDRLGD